MGTGFKDVANAPPPVAPRRDTVPARRVLHFLVGIACWIGYFGLFASIDPNSLARAEPPILAPRALEPGDLIMFVAPAGPLAKDAIDLARSRLEAMGYRVRVPDDLFRKDDYLAGPDEVRARELMEAFRDPDVDAIFPGTGGYGAMRVLDHLDFEAIRRNPKLFIGFSDITALHIAIFQRAGLITFHSPNPMWGLGSESNLTPYSAHWFFRALEAKHYRLPGSTSRPAGYVIASQLPEQEPTFDLRSDCNLDPPVALGRGTAEGRIVGGNLSLVAALMGTPFEIDTKDRILLLEDIGEAPYRVDRMLATMKLAGKLDVLAGAILGTFTRRETEDTSGEERTIDEVLRSYFEPLEIPVLHGFPVGHHTCNATIPIGARARIDAQRGTITLLEDPVRIPAASPTPSEAAR